MKIARFLIALTTAMSSVGFSVSAFADQDSHKKSISSTFPEAHPLADSSQSHPHFGIKGGFSNPEGSYHSAPELGAEIGFQPYVPFGLGAVYTSSRNGSIGSGRDLERSSVLARATYNFGGDIPVIKESWVGLAGGPVFRADGTDFGYAPVIGFDIPLREESKLTFFSLGADAKYLTVRGDQASNLSVDANLKYWF